jgi:septum formation protein
LPISIPRSACSIRRAPCCARASCPAASRTLNRGQIEAYVDREQPYDCAGSAKSEGLGIALLARIRTDDPTSLIGLPLIALTGLLTEAGLPVLA